METLPDVVRARGGRSARTLDVRTVLAHGGDAFRHIVDAVRALSPEEVLHLVAPFEPAPLYAAMRTFARAPYVERRDDAIHVWFTHDPALVESSGEASTATPRALDVRGRSAGESTLAVLQALVEGGPGTRLLVRADRDLPELSAKLSLRGYVLEGGKVCHGTRLLRVVPSSSTRAARGPIHRALTDDHERLDALLAHALLPDGSIDDEAYQEFRSGLARHVGIEEKIVVYEARRVPGVVIEGFEQMRADHARLIALLVPPPDAELVHRLQELLGPHDRLEEEPGGIYDACDAALRDRMDEVLDRIAKAPEVPMRPYVIAKRRAAP